MGRPPPKKNRTLYPPPFFFFNLAPYRGEETALPLLPPTLEPAPCRRGSGLRNGTTRERSAPIRPVFFRCSKHAVRNVIHRGRGPAAWTGVPSVFLFHRRKQTFPSLVYTYRDRKRSRKRRGQRTTLVLVSKHENPPFRPGGAARARAIRSPRRPRAPALFRSLNYAKPFSAIRRRAHLVRATGEVNSSRRTTRARISEHRDRGGISPARFRLLPQTLRRRSTRAANLHGFRPCSRAQTRFRERASQKKDGEGGNKNSFAFSILFLFHFFNIFFNNNHNNIRYTRPVIGQYKDCI